MRKVLYGLFFVLLLLISRLSYSAHSFTKLTLANEHLYNVAARVRPNNHVTLSQVMIAILNANPSAFNRHNINGLKAGYRLKIPSLSEINKLQPDEAKKLVSQHNLFWAKGVDMPPIKKKSHASSTTKKTPESIPAPETTEQAITTTPAPEIIKANSEILTLSEKVNGFIETTTKFESQTSEQLTNLEKENHTLEAKVNQLTKEVKALTYHFIQLSVKTKPKGGYRALLENLRGNAISLSAGFAFLILLSYLLARSFRSKSNSAKPESSKDEYDYMNSVESIPSKLDLARAYIDMGDFSAAKNLLKEVLMKGSSEQQQGANDLLLKMNEA